MTAASHIVFVGIAPHPPIMIPEVGRDATAEVRDGIEAMRILTERIHASGAETLVIISPHAPLEPHAFVAYHAPEMYGDFANFRAPHAVVSAPLDTELFDAISSTASEDGYSLVPLEGYELDHGTAVPLYFFLRNGWRGRVVALGYSFLSNADHLRLGSSIERAANQIKRPIALIASGDLSHRLTPDAPAGYNPRAHLFDEKVVDSIRNGALDEIVNIDQELRRTAGECGYRSMLVAIGATKSAKAACEVLNYEAPFGVGYLVAQLA